MKKIPNLLSLLLLLPLIQPITTSCGDNCNTCSSTTQSCLQCTSTTYIAIASTPIKGCLPCRPGCKSCTSEYSTCVSCAPGYYMNSTAGKCMGCMGSFCDSCDQVTPQLCVVCSNGYYLVESTGTCQACSLYPNAMTCRQSMIMSCQLGYYVSGGQKCLNCGPNCLKCTSTTFCSTCKDGYFGSSCTACHVSCQTCIRATACLTCKTGLYLNGSLCTSCPISTNSACIACDSSTKCIRCSSDYYLDQTKLCIPIQPSNKISSCTRYQITPTTLTLICKECQSGYYLSSSNTACLPCSILCSTCNGMYSTSSCTSCSANIATLMTTGVCAYTINSFINFHQNMYISQWNFPNNYTYLGSVISVQNQNCPSWKFSTRMRVKIGVIKGYNISYRMKVTFSVSNTSLLNTSGWTMSINNYSLGTLYLSTANTTPTQCSQKTPTHPTTQYTTILQSTFNPSFDTTLLSPYNPLYPDSINYIQLQSLSTNLYLTITQLSITYHTCHSSCLLCQSDTQCILCKDRSLLLQRDQCVSVCGEFYYLFGRTCVRACPAGMYGNQYAEVWTCAVCGVECSRCVSASSCISCNSGYFLFQDKCLTVCPSQYFANTLTSRCQPCSPPCFTCNSSKICLSCSYNILYNSTCISPSDCPSGYYPSLASMSCVPCQAPCSTCQSQTLCKSCLPNQGYLYKNRCITDCPPGYLKNNQTLTCDQCSPICRTCFNTTDHCLKCQTGFLLDGHCISSCPSGFFENYTTMECNLCQSPCLTCQTNAYTCRLCANGYIFHQQLNRCLIQSQCLALAGSYLGSKIILVPASTNSSILTNKTVKSCVKCPEECSKCTSPTICKSCQQNYFLLNSTCITNCPYGYFNNKKTKQCQICSQNCQTCTQQPTYCTSCPLNTHLSPTQTCTSGCLNLDQLYPTCQKCSHPCYTCTNLTTSCTSCVTGYYLNNQTKQCLSRCYDGYFADRWSRTCIKCDNSCLTCVNSSTQCTMCPGVNYLFVMDWYYQAGYCVAKCPSRYFPQILSISSQRCFRCQEPCLECMDSSTKCLSCVAGVLNINQCISECPIDKYLNSSSNSCLACSAKCLTCFGPSSSECYNCRTGYYYLQIQTKCIQNCTQNYISSPISSRCQPCEFPCLQCTNSTTTCTKCWQNTNSTVIVYYFYRSQCLRRCPSETYAVQNLCLDCKQPCKECVGEKLCLTCMVGKYFLLNQCLGTCPDGYFNDVMTMSCIKCLYPCKSCTSQTECLTCIDGVRTGTTCSMIDQCPSGQYLEYSQTNGICKQCNPQCSQCQNHPNRCLTCTNQTLTLFNHQCLQTCPTNYYPIQKQILSTTIITCTLCPIQCKECINQYNCTKCAQGLYYIQGKCVDRCPPTHFRVRVQEVDFCQVCSVKCKTCVNSQGNCLSCHIGFFWYQFQCLEICSVGTYVEYYQPIAIPLPGALTDQKYNDSFPYEINNTDPIIVPSPMPKANGICRQCLFPCKQCVNSQVCIHCLSGFYLYQGLCIENCKKPHVIYQQANGSICIQSCPITQKFVLDMGSNSKCSATCHYPYILSSNNQECLTQCPITQFINQNLQCQTKTQKISEIVSEIKVQSFIDRQYRIKIMLYFSQAVDYSQITQDLKTMLILKGYNNALYNQTTKRLLTTSPTSTQQQYSNIQYRITKLTQNYFTFQINPTTLNSMHNKYKYMVIEFKQNSNLLLKNKLTSLPVQSSLYTCLLPNYQAYPNTYQIFNNFSVFGEVLTVFLLLISVILLAFNWYAKIYESLHFYQFAFLLSVLQIQYPPNLWIFLQGFKNSHFYFIKNWFISQNQLNKITESLPKISAIFIDSNFIRIFGHIFCLLLIILTISFILFLSKFLKNTQKIQNETFKLICKKMYSKYKLIKWSHIHDFVTSITMILVFGFTVQMYDYQSRSTLQTFGILFSYVFVIGVGVYYGYMGYKLHRIVKLSQQDPRQFSDKKYLFRSNMLSITQSAIHPKELYLNYLRTARILLFGSLIGLFSLSPMLCTGCLITIFLISALVYLIIKPYPDNVQNMLLGLADVCSVCGLVFISAIYFVSQDIGGAGGEDYFRMKWVLGWFVIIFVMVGAFLLLAQLLVSIVKGNSSPLKLPAEDPKYLPPLLLGAPKNIQVSPKKELIGWEINGDDKTNTFGYRYEEKTQ